ncbi:hypothetical protein CBP36_21105 (plasmid) [Acidovorax carolinensis]|uniref:Uncharacterized protein n=1 Tax=Acidovorax carolinensis TaxID=553814 RepID=A0A240UKB8_9BURK|nr:hypothetical protein [Acidovorax carolinensis]ART61469.1 hypothetical protein CBP36_21105 [Acidovorax carolinensis]
MVTPPPSADDLRAAAIWLDANEGDADEHEPLQRVARWLEQQADAKEVRDMAREHGVRVGALRKRLVGAAKINQGKT